MNSIAWIAWLIVWFPTLYNHELKSFLVSNYLINAIRPVFKFLTCDLNGKLSWIIFIYGQVNLICEVIFQTCYGYQNSDRVP